MMKETLRDRLTVALMDYGQMPTEICVADLADYLIEVIDELHPDSKDVVMNIADNLMECPYCGKILGNCMDWTPKYCNECGKSLSGGNQIK